MLKTFASVPVAAILALGLVTTAGCPKGKADVKDPAITDFSASPTKLMDSGTATLSWTTTDATGIKITDANDQALDLTGKDAAAGSVDVSLDTVGSFTYTLTATGVEGSSAATGQVTVAVEQSAAPLVTAFSATPTSINGGDSSTLSWTTTGATSVTLVDDSSASIDVTGQGADSGSVTVSPTADTTYTLTATGPGGSATSTATVTVLPLPIIVSFTSDATTGPVVSGSPVALSWETTGADSLSLTDDAGTSVDLTGLALALDVVTVNPVVSAVYTLTATNANGNSTATVTVDVLTNIVSFTVTPDVARAGDTLALDWSVGGATAVDITGPDAFSYSATAAELAAGSTTATAGTAGDFVLTATGALNNDSVTVALSITTSPRIRSFVATPASITEGESSQLAWTVEGATTLDLVDSLGNVYDLTALSVSADTLNVTLVAPGTVTFTLTATNANGTDVVTTDVVVEAIPTIDSFAALPSRVGSGGDSTLSWSTTNAATIRLEENTVDAGVTPTTVVGSFTATALAADASYVLFAQNSLGYEVQSAPVMVTIGAPINTAFTATPSAAAPSDVVTLAWTNDGGSAVAVSDGTTDVCTDTTLAGVAAGTCTINAPAIMGSYTYTLTVSDAAGGTDTATVIIDVSDGPIIRDFSALAVDISEGDTLTLNWTVSDDPAGNATVLTLVDDLGISYDVSAVNANLGSFDVTGLAAGTYVFTLTAAGGAGTTSAVASLTVTVQALPVIVAFDASSRSLDTQGGTVVPTTDIFWTTTGGSALTLYTLDATGAPVLPAVFTAGTQAEIDNVPAYQQALTTTTVYRLHVENAIGGAVEQDVNIVVDGPVVSSFTADQVDIVAGETVNLAWTTQRATAAALDPMPVSLTTGAYTDISATGTALAFSSTDGGEAVFTFPAGFSFPYFGTPRTEAVVVTDGYLSFDVTTTSSFTNDPIPSTSTPNGGVIAAFWDDLDIKTTGQAFYELIPDAAGPDKLIIQWLNNDFYGTSGGTSDLNFEIVLWDNGNFDVNYGVMSSSAAQTRADGNSASLGFEDDTGARGFQLSRNMAVPGGLSNMGWSVQAAVPVTGNTAVNPTVDTTYTLSATNAQGSDSASVSIVVHPAAQITASAVSPVQPEVTLPFDVTWTTLDATKVVVTNAGSTVLCTITDPALVAAGSCTVTEATAGAYVYTVTATGSLARDNISTPVNVSVFDVLAINSFTASDGVLTDPAQLFVAGGTPVTLAWDLSGALGFSLRTGTGTDLTPAPWTTPGSLSLTPTVTTTYILTISDDAAFAGRTRIGQLTVYVDAAQVSSFSASAGQVQAGSTVDLSWTSSGTVTGTSLTPAATSTTTGNTYTTIVGDPLTLELTSLKGTDDGRATIDLSAQGFIFNFDGQPFSTFQACVNGWLEIGSRSTSGNWTNSNIPSSSGPEGMVVPFWDDLFMNAAGGVYYRLTGAPGSRQLVVEWADVDTWSSMGGGSMNFQVVIFEGGDLEIRYGAITAIDPVGDAAVYQGSSATVGWENLAGTGGTALLYNTADPQVIGTGITHHFALGALLPNDTVTVGVNKTTTYEVCVTGGSHTDCKTVTVVVVAPGDVLITELMLDPLAATGNGKWFELYNSSAQPVDMQGWTLTESGGGSSVIPAGTPFVIMPGQYLVFAADGAITNNGGVTADFVYDPALVLDAPADSLQLDYSGVIIDQVAWDATFPQQTGASLSFLPKIVAGDATQNDLAAAWGSQSQTFGAGDFGTPGLNNRSAVLSESFSSWPLAGWTIEDGSADGVTWGSCLVSDLGSYTFDLATPSFACVVSSGTNPLVEGLVSPPMDLSTATTATLNFNNNYQHYSGQPDLGTVEYSVDGGTTWVEVITYITDTTPTGVGTAESFDLSAATGNAAVILRFRYEDSASSSWFWAIDDVEVVTN